MALPAHFVALDTETTGLYKWRGHYPFAWGAAFPNGLRLFGRDNDFGIFKQLCEDETIDKVFTNAKFDWGMAEQKGIQVRGKVWDTSILCHLMDGRMAETGLNLEACAKRWLPSQFRKVVSELDEWFDTHGFANVKPKERYALFNQLPDDILKRRVCGDAELTLMLFMKLLPTVQHYFPFLLEQEHRLLPVVKKMEDRGVLIDNTEVIKQIEHFEHIIDDVVQFSEGVVGFDGFNINSPGHQRELLQAAGLYEQITEWTKPSKKRKSTKPFVPQRKMDAYNLQLLHHPVAHMLLIGKAAGKMISPFLTGALEFQHEGVLHASYKQVGTTSGRFSCADPNLTNIPVEGDRRASYTEDEASEAREMTGHSFAPHIKRIFKVRPGYCHVHADKKQAEMVVLCHCTKDEYMRKVFLSGESIHDGICRLLFGEVTKGLKQRSKAATFGYQYGAGVKVLAKKTGLSMAEATALKTRYGRIFPSLEKWKGRLSELVRAQGYVETDHHRRHYLRGNEDYMAVNRVCQGFIADEVKSRMVAVNDYLVNERIDGTILLNIHDDLCIEIPIEDRDKHVPHIHRIMEETAVPMFVPLPSSCDITYTRWSDLKEIPNPQDPSTYPQPPETFNEFAAVA